MRVFVGKMNDVVNYNKMQCSGVTYFGGMQKGDLAFIRLISGGYSSISCLWEFDYLDAEAHLAHFKKVFDFKQLTVDEFSKLKFFNIDIVFGNKMVTQTPPNVGFFKLEICNQKEFDVAIQSKVSFEKYINDKNNYRKVVYVDNPLNTKPSDEIQIYKNGNVYDIFNKSEPFLSGIVNVFKPQRYLQYKAYLGTNKPSGENGKVYTWLEKEGKTNIDFTIRKLWNFFCSNQKFGSKSKNKQPIVASGVKVNDEESKHQVSSTIDFPKNLIIYGIPGCGKSYKLKNGYLVKFDSDIIRTTFHPEYTNTDFVGQVRPVKNGNNIEYKVIPGPFTKALFKAYKNPDRNIALVIEEINRGNAAAIFGDLFQLLDRDDFGASEYRIVNETIMSYLKDNDFNREEIFLPSNLYIFATMNTSDQNVFKLDTAFKRRWEFIRLTNKDTEQDLKNNDFVVFKINGVDIKWSKFIEEINKKIVNSQDIGGDRQIGNFFYKEDKNKSDAENLKRFANKVLEYLYNDVYKFDDKEEIFNVNKYKSFDDIYNAFINGENVFNELLFEVQKENEVQSVSDDEKQE